MTAIILTIVIIVIIIAAVCKGIGQDNWGSDSFVPPPTTPRRTMRCPSCGADAVIKGDMWECGYCGDCGFLR